MFRYGSYLSNFLCRSVDVEDVLVNMLIIIAEAIIRSILEITIIEVLQVNLLISTDRADVRRLWLIVI